MPEPLYCSVLMVKMLPCPRLCLAAQGDHGAPRAGRAAHRHPRGAGGRGRGASSLDSTQPVCYGNMCTVSGTQSRTLTRCEPALSSSGRSVQRVWRLAGAVLLPEAAGQLIAQTAAGCLGRVRSVQATAGRHGAPTGLLSAFPTPSNASVRDASLPFCAARQQVLREAGGAVE